MKIKTAHETAGIGPGHRYLGHFAKPKFINQGHNDTPISDKEKKAKVYSDTEPQYDKGFGLPQAQHNMDPGIHIHTPLPTTTRDRNESNPSDAMDRRLLRPKVRM